MAGSMIGADGAEVHCTEHHRYPLPPPMEGRAAARMHFGRYVVPHPETGVATKYTRMTTYTSTLDDKTGLEKWKTRMAVAGFLRNTRLADRYRTSAESGAAPKALDAIVESARVAAGASEAAEFGTAVHAWLEAIDQGRMIPAMVPEMYREHVHAYMAALARHAVYPVPEYTERTVLNTEYGLAGTLDRIYQLPDDRLVMGDVKTSKSLEYGYLSYSMQMAGYASADLMLSLDGTRWEPMPELVSEWGILAHVPSNDPGAAALVTFDLAVGRTGLETARLVRDLRKGAKTDVPHRHAMPTPGEAMARRARAIAAIKTSTTPADMGRAWEEYQDVWTDDLTNLGHAVIEASRQVESKATP